MIDTSLAPVFDLIIGFVGRRVQASWEHFFVALRQYVNTLKRNLTQPVGQSMQNVQISPDELAALNAWLHLATQVAKQVFFGFIVRVDQFVL